VEKQATGHGPEGCDENGPAPALLVGYVSIQICALFNASPARTALPTAHFDRNESHVFCGTGHYRVWRRKTEFEPKGAGSVNQDTQSRVFTQAILGQPSRRPRDKNTLYYYVTYILITLY
jgi:hypothetical protein